MVAIAGVAAAVIDTVRVVAASVLGADALGGAAVVDVAEDGVAASVAVGSITGDGLSGQVRVRPHTSRTAAGMRGQPWPPVSPSSNHVPPTVRNSTGSSAAPGNRASAQELPA